MVIDVHCHLGLTGLAVRREIERFRFEPEGAAGNVGFDSYVAPRLLKRIPFRLIQWWWNLEGGPTAATDPAFNAKLLAIFERHFQQCPSVDALVLLAFDEYHDEQGKAHGPTATRRLPGTDTYTSNSFVRDFCRRDSKRYLFGASIHPYRRGALPALDEVHQAGAVLVKWLPLNQNIDAADPRTVEFLRSAGQLRMPMLIHYGGEMSTTVHRPDQMDPRPLLKVLSQLRREGTMPTVIVAHVATPSYPWHYGRYVDPLARALTGEFRDAPLYADLAGMTNRPYWLWALAKQQRWRGLHSKLLFGSDFPIVASSLPFWWHLRHHWKEVRSQPSWIEQNLWIIRALGFDQSVFHRAAEMLAHRLLR